MGTTALGFEYADGPDSVSSLPATMQALAQWINDHVGLHYGDRSIFNFTAVPQVQTIAVAFPAGLFTVAADIMVTATIQSTDAAQNFSAVTLDGPPSLTGCSLKCQRTAGTPGNVTVHWHAFQIAP